MVILLMKQEERKENFEFAQSQLELISSGTFNNNKDETTTQVNSLNEKIEELQTKIKHLTSELDSMKEKQTTNSDSIGTSGKAVEESVNNLKVGLASQKSALDALLKAKQKKELQSLLSVRDICNDKKYLLPNKEAIVDQLVKYEQFLQRMAAVLRNNPAALDAPRLHSQFDMYVFHLQQSI
jgi:predicted RNase H-like nuclease (RuvC/YqgF family)